MPVAIRNIATASLAAMALLGASASGAFDGTSFSIENDMGVGIAEIYVTEDHERYWESSTLAC